MKCLNTCLRSADTTTRSFRVADIVDLPFEDGFFDVACCNDVLAYVPDTQAALSEVKRILKPGGPVI